MKRKAKSGFDTLVAVSVRGFSRNTGRQQLNREERRKLEREQRKQKVAKCQ